MPGREQPVLNNEVNPLYGGASLRHPSWSPGGHQPVNPQVPFGVMAWTAHTTQRFKSNGTDQVWLWESPVFDLRPGMSIAYGTFPAAVQINHEGALGQAIYLNLAVGESSGTVPPSTKAGMKAYYWSDGNVVMVNANNTAIQNMTQVIEVTDQLQAGGTNTVITNPSGPFGASVFSFSPPAAALRFWKLTFKLVVDGVTPITEPYFIQACLH